MTGAPPSRPCSAMTDAMCAWWCCTARSGRPPAPRSPRPARRAVAGVPVGGQQLRGDAGERAQLPPGALEGRHGGEVGHVADVRRRTRRGRPRRGTACSSGRRRRPARARTGTRQGERRGRVAAGAAQHGSSPRRRRTRTTESSHGTWMAPVVPRARRRRSRPSRSSASASSVTMGSPARLPLVITSTRGPGGSPGSPNSRWCSGVYGSITPMSGLPGRHRRPARSGAAARAGAAARSGRRRPVSSGALRRADVGQPLGRRPGRRTSPRTACRRGPCARAARPRPPGSAASQARW